MTDFDVAVTDFDVAVTVFDVAVTDFDFPMMRFVVGVTNLTFCGFFEVGVKGLDGGSDGR
ncbi:hypothetical protein [Limnohabitans sp. Rim47]|uniref:hypothetical protein n=1 Tax=Limnohabitans sp. Rim47 TaxID=1100721 RepID=UPI00037EF41E|nr:hypothetical protein [Limnohabitans sp. Rim47]